MEKLEKLIEEEVERRLAEMQAVKVEGKPFVIVRSRDAGVHAGYLESESENGKVVLRCSRRLWRYYTSGIGTCSDLALTGLDSAKSSRIAPKLPLISIYSTCEVIPASELSRQSIQSWENQNE